jgi:tripartite-type tricarboxylate transporter receptor subunit TctC
MTAITRRRAAAGLLGLPWLASAAAAQPAYPDRPVRLVVPYTPGGQFDTHARLLAARMESILGKPMIVENRPGGGTMIGGEYVARQRNDGYTLLMAGATLLAIAPHLYRRVPYKIEDFDPVSLVNSLPMAMVVNPAQLPVTSFQEFVAYARARPNELIYATTGQGVTTHLLGELMCMKLGLQMTPAHYRGTSPALSDVLGGRVPIIFDGLLTTIQHIESGRLRALGVSSRERLPGAPSIPSFAEMGHPELAVSSWAGIVVPTGTPPAIIAQLNEATVAAVRSPEVSTRMVADATVPMPSTAAEFAALIRSDSAVWGDVVRSLDLKLD